MVFYFFSLWWNDCLEVVDEVGCGECVGVFCVGLGVVVVVYLEVEFECYFFGYVD